MVEKFIKGLFALVGAATGVTVVRTFFLLKNNYVTDILYIVILLIVSSLFAWVFYLLGNKIVIFIVKATEKIEIILHNLTLYEMMISSIGLIVGLIVANLITISITRVQIIGVPISVCVNILCGSIGVFLVISKRNDKLFESLSDNVKSNLTKNKAYKKVLDTSVIIDGRIIDICRSGFIEGEIIVPDFVLEELRRLSDSADDMKRSKGRRGLDNVKVLQETIGSRVKIEKVKLDDEENKNDVDQQLLKYGLETGAKVVTNDYNLNKIATIKKISVLNVNDLANAVKPMAISGEEMNIKVVKAGKEKNQGIGYLQDGTMIVIEDGSKYKGQDICVTVTSVLQTSAGRLIFAKPKKKSFAIIN